MANVIIVHAVYGKW